MSSIDSVMQETRVFPPSAETITRAHVSGMAAYEALCAEADADSASSRVQRLAFWRSASSC